MFFRIWIGLLLLTKNVWAQAQEEAVKAVVVNPPTTLSVGKIIDMVVEGAVKYSFQALGGIIVLILAWFIGNFLSRMTHDFLKKKHVDITVAKFMSGAVKILVMIFAGLVALGKFGIEIAPFIAGLSVIGFGTSFALQGALSNYVAGMTLIFTKPFKVGDIIEVVGQNGEVEDMTLPRTILRNVDGTIIYIPNKHIVGEIIQNYSALKRLDIKVGVGYKTDIDKAIAVVQKIVQKETRLHKNQDVKFGISEFGDSSVNLYARVWCQQEVYWDVLFSINKAILDEFQKNNIEIPYPQREVHLYQEKK